MRIYALPQRRANIRVTCVHACVVCEWLLLLLHTARHLFKYVCVCMHVSAACFFTICTLRSAHTHTHTLFESSLCCTFYPYLRAHLIHIHSRECVCSAVQHQMPQAASRTRIVWGHHTHVCVRMRWCSTTVRDMFTQTFGAREVRSVVVRNTAPAGWRRAHTCMRFVCIWSSTLA